MLDLNLDIQQLLERQTSTWDTARDNYAALADVRVKHLCVDGVEYKVQFNPARILSSAAKVDSKSVRERKCFLCAANRPPQQEGVPFNGHYCILVNPYPIFPRHLTIPDDGHMEQRIATRFGDMLLLAQALTAYTIFYNGPRCGASAPDHAHFQAGNKGFMPIEENWHRRVAGKVAALGRASLFRLNDAPRSTLVISSDSAKDAETLFQTVYNCMEIKPGDEEPMMNVLAMYGDNEEWTVFIFPREKHRPACYTAVGEDNMLCSPASVDLGGVFITPVEKDFDKITSESIKQILSEVCLPSDKFALLCDRIHEAVGIRQPF